MAKYYKKMRPLGVFTLTQFDTEIDGYPAPGEMGKRIFLDLPDAKNKIAEELNGSIAIVQEKLKRLKAEKRAMDRLRENYFTPETPSFPVITVADTELNTEDTAIHVGVDNGPEEEETPSADDIPQG